MRLDADPRSLDVCRRLLLRAVAVDCLPAALLLSDSTALPRRAIAPFAVSRRRCRRLCATTRFAAALFPCRLLQPVLDCRSCRRFCSLILPIYDYLLLSLVASRSRRPAPCLLPVCAVDRRRTPCCNVCVILSRRRCLAVLLLPSFCRRRPLWCRPLWCRPRCRHCCFVRFVFAVFVARVTSPSLLPPKRDLQLHLLSSLLFPFSLLNAFSENIEIEKYAGGKGTEACVVGDTVMMSYALTATQPRTSARPLICNCRFSDTY